MTVDCSFVGGFFLETYAFFIFSLRGSDGGFDMITYGFGAIFSYVYIAGGGVRHTSLIFTRVLAHGFVERADRKRRHLGFGFRTTLFLVVLLPVCRTVSRSVGA